MPGRFARILSAAALIIAALSGGCGVLEEEDITPEETAAADNITVTFRHIDPRISIHNVRQYVRGGTLFIEGEMLNNSPHDKYNLALRVTAFDEEGRAVQRDLPLFYPLPRFLPPGGGAHFRIELPADLAAVAVETAD